MAAPSLRVGFAWAFVGNAVFAASQWLAQIAIAKLGSPEQLGQLAVAVAVTTPIVQFLNLNLRALQSTDARREFAFFEYLGLRIVSLGPTLAGIALVSWLLGYRGVLLGVVALVAATKIVESLSDTAYGDLQQREELEPIARSLAIRGVGYAIGIGAGMLADNLIGGLALATTAWFAVLWGYDLPRRARNGEPGAATFDFARLRALALRALPLGMVMLLYAVATSTPTYFLQKAHGEREVGMFAAASQLVQIGLLVLTALGQTASPRLAQLAVSGDRAGFVRLFWRLVAMVVAMGTLGVAFAWMFGAWLLRVFYTPEYAAYATELVWLSAGAAVTLIAGPLGVAITALGVFRAQAWMHGTRVLLTIALCVWWIPEYGVLGAAWVVLVTGIFAVAWFGTLLALVLSERRGAALR